MLQWLRNLTRTLEDARKRARAGVVPDWRDPRAVLAWINVPAEELPFLEAIALDPDDDGARLVFADWLEERGDPRAEGVRLEVALARTPRDDPGFVELYRRADRTPGAAAIPLPPTSGPLPADYRVQFLQTPENRRHFLHELLQRRGTLANCGQARTSGPRLRFSFRCPQTWSTLQLTADPGVRFCAGCQQDVHRCGSIPEAERHARQGHCIAIPSRLADEVLERHQPMITGRPTVVDALESWGEKLFPPSGG